MRLMWTSCRGCVHSINQPIQCGQRRPLLPGGNARQWLEMLCKMSLLADHFFAQQLNHMSSTRFSTLAQCICHECTPVGLRSTACFGLNVAARRKSLLHQQACVVTRLLPLVIWFSQSWKLLSWWAAQAAPACHRVIRR